MPGRPVLAGLAALAVLACGSAASTPPATSSLAPLLGNAVAVPLPSDAPGSVQSRGPLFACGAQILFEADVDITPIPTAPQPTTEPETSQRGLDCLIGAWKSHRSAEFITSETSDEGDEIFTIYRLPGDGTLQMLVRVWSHADKTVAWTQAVCHQLTLESGRVTPADCNTETPIS